MWLKGFINLRQGQPILRYYQNYDKFHNFPEVFSFWKASTPSNSKEKSRAIKTKRERERESWVIIILRTLCDKENSTSCLHDEMLEMIEILSKQIPFILNLVVFVFNENNSLKSFNAVNVIRFDQRVYISESFSCIIHLLILFQMNEFSLKSSLVCKCLV